MSNLHLKLLVGVLATGHRLQAESTIEPAGPAREVPMDQLLNHVRGFSFGGMTYDKGGLFGPILRPYLSLIMVETGTCTLRTDDHVIKVSGGQTGLTATGRRFDFDYQKGTRTTVIWCEGFLPKRPPAEFSEANVDLASIETPASIRQLLEIGLSTGHASRPDLNAMRDALGQAVCKAYLYEARKGVEDQSIPIHILKARRFIEENLGDDTIDIAAIAANSSVSAQHLITSFRKNIGTTPSRYLWRMRANRARQLLIHTQFSQSDIAHRCGYLSLPHFSRSIKNLFGMTPAKLRRDMGFTEPSNTDASVRDLIY
jgi:AraC-like DNA-binding protein